MSRFYGAPRETAGEIASECIAQGFSTGWCGDSLATLDTIKTILAPYGIKYVCDMAGRWEPRNAGNNE